MPINMQPSLSQYRATLRREGIVKIPYRDGEGWSIGGGRYLGKKHPGKMTVTVAEAIADVKKHYVGATKQVNQAIHVPIEQHQFDALLDLLYQGGTDGLNAVAKIINDRDPTDRESVRTSNREAAREFLQWDTTAAGEHNDGLLKRRGLNVGLFLGGEYGSDLSKVPTWDRIDEKTQKPVMKEAEWIIVNAEEWL